MMPVSKGGGLHVYHDQVVRAMHDVSILPQKKAQIQNYVCKYTETHHKQCFFGLSTILIYKQ
jgi:predicted ATP-grasp superfamily ATP-dependent carboligase